MPILLIGGLLLALFLATKKTTTPLKNQNAHAPKATNVAQALMGTNPASNAVSGVVGSVNSLFPNSKRVTRTFSDQQTTDLVGAGAGLAKGIGSVLPGIFKDIGVDQATAGGGTSRPNGSVADAQDFQALSQNVYAQDKALEAMRASLGLSSLGAEQSGDKTAASDMGVETAGSQLTAQGANSFNYANGFAPGDNVQPDTGTDGVEQRPADWTNDPSYWQNLDGSPPTVDGAIPTDSGAAYDIPEGDAVSEISGMTATQEFDAFSGGASLTE